MNIEYYILNPSGNITALVVTKVNPKDYALINSEIMKKHKDVEQVGFVDFDNEQPCLCMSGGEFCGNATMCTALLFCKTRGIFGELYVNVSGIDNPIKTEVLYENGEYKCCGYFEKANQIRKVPIKIGGKDYVFPYISLKGISHFIFDYGFDRNIAVDFIKEYCQKNGLAALGIMFFDKESKKNEPLVYVNKIETVFFENSCASGCCAICSFVFDKGTGIIDISQPGGIIRAENTGKQIKLYETITVSNLFSFEM